jgi:molybdopterin-guanine dinucleotide biosynthesis protein A
VPDAVAHLERLPDAQGVSGPLSGLLSALRWQPAARWLVVACDLPQLTSEAAEWLLAHTRIGIDAVLPRLQEDSPGEPLLALYEPTCLPRLELAAARGTWALREALADAPVGRPLVPPDLRSAWTNVNTPEEWEEVQGGGGASPNPSSST